MKEVPCCRYGNNNNNIYVILSHTNIIVKKCKQNATKETLVLTIRYEQGQLKSLRKSDMDNQCNATFLIYF